MGVLYFISMLVVVMVVSDSSTEARYVNSHSTTEVIRQNAESADLHTPRSLIRRKRFWWALKKDEEDVDITTEKIQRVRAATTEESWGDWFRSIGSSIKSAARKTKEKVKSVGRKIKSGLNKIRRKFSRSDENFSIFANKVKERVAEGDEEAITLLEKLGIDVDYDKDGNLIGTHVHTGASNVSDTLSREGLLIPTEIESEEEEEDEFHDAHEWLPSSSSTTVRAYSPTEETLFEHSGSQQSTVATPSSNSERFHETMESEHSSVHAISDPVSEVGDLRTTSSISESTISKLPETSTKLPVDTTKVVTYETTRHDASESSTVTVTSKPSATVFNPTSKSSTSPAASKPTTTYHESIITESENTGDPVSELKTTRTTEIRAETTSKREISTIPASSETSTTSTSTEPSTTSTSTEASTTSTSTETSTTSTSTEASTTSTSTEASTTSTSTEPSTTSTSTEASTTSTSTETSTTSTSTEASTTSTSTETSTTSTSTETSPSTTTIETTPTTFSTSTVTETTTTTSSTTTLVPASDKRTDDIDRTPPPFPDIFGETNVRDRLHDIFLNADFSHDDLRSTFNFDPAAYDDYYYDY